MLRKTTKLTAAIIIFTLLSTFCTAPEKDSSIHPVNLRCENLKNPIAIDIATPLLSWNMESPGRNQMQSAYHILVSSSQNNLDKDVGDYWDTGKIASDQSVNIKYDGYALKSRDVLYWKVKTWNAKDKPSAWSETSSWEMSFLEQSDWQALWIGIAEDEAPLSTKTYPAPFFRKEIELSKSIKSGKVFVCGLGYYELYINSVKIGDHVLAPAQTNYDKRGLPKLLYHYDDQSTTRVFYNTFDVTRQLKSGKNAIGMVLGNGWYNQRDRIVEGDLWYTTPRLIFQLEIEYTDGKKEVFTSNENWKVTTGPLLHDGIFTGEIYDARLELGDWSSPEYDDANWKKAQLVRPPTGEMESQLAPPDKVTRTFKPHSITTTEDGICIVDAGEMISGWIRLNVNEKKEKKLSCVLLKNREATMDRKMFTSLKVVEMKFMSRDLPGMPFAPSKSVALQKSLEKMTSIL